MSDDTNATEPKRRGKGVRRRRNYVAEMAEMELRVKLACEILHGCTAPTGDCSKETVKLALSLLERPRGGE